MLTDMIGRTFGDFRIKSKLGEGGSGSVYIAEQASVGRDVALKLLTEQLEVSAAARFLREVRLAAALDHPYAAHVYASGADADNTLWIAMELVRGIPLDTLLAAHGPIPLARFVPFFERLCEVLAAAHDQGIVHRDIKPANVMVLQRAGRLLPKLLDLGIARATVIGHSEEPETIDVAVEDGVDPAFVSAATLTLELDSQQLTRAGAIVGTPHYMAPEQWVRASHVDARADIYSAALLAYQCLVGEKPFTGSTVIELARGHARKPLPSLGERFPEALHAVLAKGAAKKPNDRYATALELAAAFRQASRFGLEPLRLPQLAEALRENWLHHAPQPIAESIELWEAASAPRQALEAIERVSSAVVRYIAVLALAARLKIGPGVSGDAEDARETLSKLRSDRLDDAEWLALGVQLVRPFEQLGEAYPIRELLEFFLGAGFDHATDLLRLVGAARSAANDELGAPLQVIVTRLGQVLEAATFVFDYPLVVLNDSAEHWMGPRRVKRETVKGIPHPCKDGSVALFDRDGAEVLRLTPLVQCLLPSGGAPDELFFLDGEGRGGARLVTWPASYQRHDELLWTQLAEHGLTIANDSLVSAQTASPYKGLTTFSSEDADNYFGRERESEAFANRLRHGRFLAVVGPSGTGKSSFVLAGVLPLLPKSFTPIVFRPSATPLAALMAKLQALGYSSGSKASATTVADAVAALIADGTTWVLVVDQLEELVTLCLEGHERAEFADVLLALSRHPSNKLRVVATLRDDFLIAIQQIPAFAEDLSSSLQLLGTPRPEDLERVITEPAKRVGYVFDDTALPARMVDEVREIPGALALLSFTASQLWELRDRQLHLMRAKTYHALGGVGGALAHHAESTLSALAEPQRLLVRELFRHLVTAQGTRAVLSKDEAHELIGGGASASAVIEQLINARLIVSSESATIGDSVEIIHEALIGAWPRLVEWRRENAESARVRDALRAAARQWVERGRPNGLLWRKETLAEYRVWRPRFDGRLTGSETEFAAASLRDEARARAARRIAIAVTVLSLAVGFGIATRSWLIQKRKLLETWREQARVAMMGGHPSQAILYATAADRAGGDSPSLDHILGAASALLSGTEYFVRRAPRGFQLIRSSPDGRLALALGDGPAMLLDTVAAQPLATWNLPCPNGAFSPQGDQLVLSCLDGVLRFVDVHTLKIREVATRNRFDVLFDASPDGARFAPNVEGESISAFTWDGQPAFTATVAGAKTLELAFSSRGGGALISGDFAQYPSSFDGVTVVDDHGREIWSHTLPRPARIAAFAPDGTTLAVGLLDHSIEVFDVGQSHERWSARVHDDFIRTLSFDREGKRLLTTGNDGAVHILDAATGRSLTTPRPPGGEVRIGAWLPGETEVLIGSGAGTITRIDAATGHTLWTYHGHTGTIQSISVLPSTREFLSGSEDGEIWRWPLDRSLDKRISADVVAIWGKPGGAITATAKELRVRLGAGPEATLRPVGVARPDLAFVDFSLNGVVAVGDQASVGVYEARGFRYELAWSRRLATTLASVAVPDDGSMIAAIDDDGEATVLDRSGNQLSRFNASKSHGDNVVFDAAGRLVVMTTSGEMVLYEARTGTLLRRIPAHLANARLNYGSRPHQFVSFGFDELVKVWSDEDWSAPRYQVSVTDLPNAAVVDPTARMIAIVESSPRIVIYDLVTGKPLSYVLLPSPAVQAIWTDDGTGILAVTDDGLIAAPVFFAHPPSELIERLERCRIAEALDGEEIVPRTPDCPR